MKRRNTFWDPFVLGGFVTSFFNGFLYPVYVTVVLSRLDARLIALGSVLSGGLPVAVGLALENRRLEDRLYALLPALMVAEAAAGFAAVLVAQGDLATYYVLSMVILGLFSSTVTYLLQRVKEHRYRRGRATFDRRCSMADALGFVIGSGVSIAGVPSLEDPLLVAFLCALQTAVVYALLLNVRRRVPRVRRVASREAEDPFPWASPLRAGLAG